MRLVSKEYVLPKQLIVLFLTIYTRGLFEESLEALEIVEKNLVGNFETLLYFVAVAPEWILREIVLMCLKLE
jgi:hypothetical protein